MLRNLKFLIDNALSPALAAYLREAGWDAIHIRDRLEVTADDQLIVELAAREDRVIISVDTDFGTLLARQAATKPSVILFRLQRGRRPEFQLSLLVQNLPQISESLAEGSVVVFEQSRIRIRRLPIGG